MKPNGLKRKYAVDSSQQLRKYPQTPLKRAPVVSDKPQVIIKQLLPSDTMIKVFKSSVDRNACWRNSANLVSQPLQSQLSTTSNSFDVEYPSMWLERCRSMCLDTQAFSKTIKSATLTRSSQQKSPRRIGTK